MQMTEGQERQHKMKTREWILLFEKDKKTADSYDSDRELKDKRLLYSGLSVEFYPDSLLPHAFVGFSFVYVTWLLSSAARPGVTSLSFFCRLSHPTFWRSPLRSLVVPHGAYGVVILFCCFIRCPSFSER